MDSIVSGPCSSLLFTRHALRTTCDPRAQQENIETDRGRLSCSHRPEMDKVANFIRQGDGRFLLLKLAKVSHLYKNVGKTAEKVRNGEVRSRRVSLPTRTLLPR